MQISTLFVLCALVVAACAQSAFIIDLPVGGTDVDVGIQSDWFFIRAPVTPNTTVTVSISEGTDNTDLSATSLTFTPTIQQLSFRFTTKVTGFITFDLSLDNTDQFIIASTFTVYSQPRALQLDQSFPTSFYLDLVTEPIKLYITEPHTSALTLTPTITTYPAGNAVPVSISPSTITIAAGDLSASFVITASTTQFAGLVQLSWGTIGGDSNNWFTTSLIDSTGFALSTNLRTSIVAPSFSSSFITGPASNTLYFYTSGDRPNDTLTITPQAADTTFSPSSISLDANTQVAQFTVTTTSTETDKPVYFYTSNTASNYFTKIAAGTLNSPKLNFWIDSPSTFAVTKPSKISIKIEYPATNDVSVTLYAANLIFNPATVAFSGATTGIDVTVTPVNTGSDTISFKVTGTDANWYNVPEDYSVGIEKGSITGPASWYVPSLFVGQESDPLPLRLNFAPATDIVVTPMAPDVIFTPANLTFTPNTVEQFFTITPVLAGTAVSRNVPISFAVSGTDWAWFTAPASTSVTVSQRILQTAWTSDIELGETTTVYVGRDYTVWVSTNFVGSSDSFTVTPVSNYFTFNPQILTFNSGTLRATYTATPIAGVRSATSASITYIVSGQAAGYYNSLPTDSLSISIRPLYFYSATVSRDDRLPAALTRYVNASNYGALSTASYYIGQALTSNHVHSFSIATPAFPKSKVTITPKSAHISFSPSSVTLTSSSSTTIWAPATVTLPGAASYLQNGWEPTYLAIANFTVSGSAAGSHDVWFELSSDDADYYAPPPHTYVTIRKYTGGGSSASSTVVASVGMIVASIVLALFL